MNVGIDKSRFIRRAISEVTETLFIAIGLVVLIIYLFFRNWIIALRPLIDIPVSLIGAFFLMWLFGFSINVLTLLAIVLATGLVDSLPAGSAGDGAARLRRVVAQITDPRGSAAEVAASYSRGARVGAIACRVELLGTPTDPRWQLVALHIG